jgi:hypothetical protein
LVLARLRRRWSLSGREGLGSSLPPVELARRDSGVFEELKRLFSTTPEVGKETEANIGHRGDRTLNQTRPVIVQCLRVFRFDDRTRGASDRSGSLLDSNRTLALSRLVISPARPVIVLLCAAQADQRVRSFMGLVRPVGVSEFSRWATSASGQLDQRVRSVLRGLAVARPARPVSSTGASGQFDRHVRSVRPARPVVPKSAQ